MKLVVSGAAAVDDVPGLATITDEVELLCAPDREQLESALPGAEVLLGWDFQNCDIPDLWHAADALKWIHWCGAAVDTVLCPQLAASDVQLTNARGTFDLVMAEYVLGYMLSEFKQFRFSWGVQQRKEWQTGLTRQLRGTHATVVGVGSIGRETAKLLNANGITVTGVGRRARTNDPDFGTIFGPDRVREAVRDADWVIGLLPLTKQTELYFGKDFFDAMKTEAYFINLGRGESVDEDALVACLERGGIAGAMLDVFQEEPLSPANPLWSARKIVISPHMSSYFVGYEKAMADQFLDNFSRYRSRQPLSDVIDKQLGFAVS